MPPIKETEVPADHTLFADITRMITESKALVAQTVNSALTMLYWKVGKPQQNDWMGKTLPSK